MDLRCASNPKDVKHYTTERLREEFHISGLFTPDNSKMVYSHIDRIITAGFMPVKQELVLEAGKELAADYFLQRREMGCINIGGKGIITVDGTDYQLSGFGGFKLLGVKPQTDANKMAVCLAIANYLTGEECQIARYNAVAWGPSNLTAQQDSSVQSDEALSALAEQLAYTIPQGQYPNDYWTLATSLGDSIIAGDYDNASDDDLMKALESFQSSCESYAQ